MLIPRRVKHRKQHHPKKSGAAKGGKAVKVGERGNQSLEPEYVTNRQIESARIAITRHIRRGGKVWINIYPDRPLTKKPAETRMGSGKGSPEWWIANVKPGRVMFELSFPNEKVAKDALTRAIHKLPMKCRIVRREGGEAGWRSDRRPWSPRAGAASTTSACSRSCARPRRSCSTCGSSRPPGSWRATGGCAP